MFTKLGRILAVMAVLWGVMRIAMAVAVLMSDDPSWATVRYLGTKTTGQVIDQGLYTIIFGILVGVLTDISKSLFSIRDAKLNLVGNQATELEQTP
ncbi:hypothetical protein SuNHUV7_10710 (plasmid) [Pseudoseohaeicola sp. NH-UV-7]|uniref:hypothetical protein n=1 Tax=unclassified Sulfitobacter TaxID=196795 RepID=UPI000E0C8217|nr:hypothetical protein [Sulfitobacter sp. JL08]AXI53248.1 hypothetical protein C1J05_00910 [Sulfitobacter sp. JL08]